VQYRRPLDLRHPQRIAGRPPGGHAQAVTDLPHRPSRAAERPCNLPQAATGAQPPLDLRVPIHREPPPCHAPLPFVVAHDGTGPKRLLGRLRRWSQSRKSVVPIREIAWGLSGEIRWSQSRKSTGPHQRKSRSLAAATRRRAWRARTSPRARRTACRCRCGSRPVGRSRGRCARRRRRRSGTWSTRGLRRRAGSASGNR
jgi:hypothetical protein